MKCFHRIDATLQDLSDGKETFKEPACICRVAAVPSSALLPCNSFKKLSFSHVEYCGSSAEFTVIMTESSNDWEMIRIASNSSLQEMEIKQNYTSGDVEA